MYTVGDIIWVVSSSYPSVKPYQVVEEIIHKTLKGTVKSFNVRRPDGSQDVVAISDLDGDIFIDADSVKTELNERASNAIDNMIDAGKTLIEKHFSVLENGLVFEGDKDISAENDEQSSDNNQDYVILPDGTKAKLNIKGDIL